RGQAGGGGLDGIGASAVRRLALRLLCRGALPGGRRPVAGAKTDQRGRGGQSGNKLHAQVPENQVPNIATAMPERKGRKVAIAAMCSFGADRHKALPP